MGPLGLDHMTSSIEHMGQTMALYIDSTDRQYIGSGMEHMGASMSFGLDHMAAPTDRVGQTIELVHRL